METNYFRWISRSIAKTKCVPADRDHSCAVHSIGKHLCHCLIFTKKHLNKIIHSTNFLLKRIKIKDLKTTIIETRNQVRSILSIMEIYKYYFATIIHASIILLHIIIFMNFFFINKNKYRIILYILNFFWYFIIIECKYLKMLLKYYF